jgi:peptidoglycan/xylan/chitin deacetylase (PgdA/CDA1 family)
MSFLKSLARLSLGIWLLAATMAFGQSKRICLSIDDLPIVAYGVTDTTSQRNISDRLIHSLVSAHVPAIGFVNEQKLYSGNLLSAFQVSLLRRWVEAGLDLGNHTFSHPDFNNTGCEEFFVDILKGETISREILAAAGKKLMYFRHPFLHLGNTKEKADSLHQFLVRRGYTVAPVTIDNDDYIFAVAYHRARVNKDSTLAAKIGHDYIDYMQEKLHYFEQHSLELFGRPISQIFLVHASRLNAEYLDSLVAMCSNNGYQFVSIGEALNDEAYRAPIEVYGNWGISWLDRWAMTQKRPKDFFRNEPQVPGYITRLAE